MSLNSKFHYHDRNNNIINSKSFSLAGELSRTFPIIGANVAIPKKEMQNKAIQAEKYIKKILPARRINIF